MWGDLRQPDVEATDITVADWLEVIRAADHEMPWAHRPAPINDGQWMADPIVSEELVVFLQIECLKRARYRACLPAN